MIEALIEKYNAHLINTGNLMHFASLEMYIDGMTDEEVQADFEAGAIDTLTAYIYTLYEEPQPDGTIKTWLKGFSKEELLAIIKADDDFMKSLLSEMDILLYILRNIYE